MTTQSPELTVVIPTWNRAPLVVDVLDSLSKQTLDKKRFEVIVVDDGSTDGTPASVEQFGRDHPDLQVRVVSHEHGGVNAARNGGMSAARAPLICFLDDDELAPPDYLARTLQLLKEHPGVAGVGGPATEHGRATLRTCSMCSIGTATIAVNGTGMTDRLLGGNMTLRSDVVNEVGPFDAELSGRGDETEWFHRAARQFLYDDSLVIWHRRDVFTRRELCRIQLRQGRALPLASDKQDGEHVWRPSPARVLRYVGHALARRCDNGYLLAARELGATAGWLEMRSPTASRKSQPESPR